MTQEINISREAAVRRFVKLHPDDLAVVFCKDSRFVYAACGRDFPRLSLPAGAQYDLGKPVQGTISSFDDVASDRRLHAAPDCLRIVSSDPVARQRLLDPPPYSLADQSGDDGPGFDDTFERLVGGQKPIKTAARA